MEENIVFIKEHSHDLLVETNVRKNREENFEMKKERLRSVIRERETKRQVVDNDWKENGNDEDGSS